MGGGGGLKGGEGGDGGDLGGGGLGLGGGGLGFGGGDAFGATAPAPSSSSRAHKSTLSITRGAMRCAWHVSDCPCNSSARRRTFTDTLQPRERPAERSLSASLQDRRGAGPSTSPPAQIATALLRRSTTAPPVCHQRATHPERAVQRATLHGKHQALRKRELGGARAQQSPAARPAVPCAPGRRSTCTGRRSTGGARVSSACGAETRRGVVPAGSAQQGAAPARNRPTRGHEASGRGAWWARCGDGWRRWWSHRAEARWARAVEAGMRSGGAGAAQAGKGQVSTLWAAVVTGVAENEEVEYRARFPGSGVGCQPTG